MNDQEKPTGTDAEAETEAETEAQTETETEAEDETEADETETEAEAEAEAETEAEPLEVEFTYEPGAEGEGETEADTMMTFLQSVRSLYGLLAVFCALWLGAVFAIKQGSPLSKKPEPRTDLPKLWLGTPPLAGLPKPTAAAINSEVLVTINSPFAPGAFPCTECHDPEDDDLQPRKLEMEHTGKNDLPKINLNHGSIKWCLACHHPTERDYLRFSDGRKLEFKNFVELCGQCHGKIYREWKLGVHGKRTGYWNGVKNNWVCTECHNPHSPAFKPLRPMPPPPKPSAR